MDRTEKNEKEDEVTEDCSEEKEVDDRIMNVQSEVTITGSNGDDVGSTDVAGRTGGLAGGRTGGRMGGRTGDADGQTLNDKKELRISEKNREPKDVDGNETVEKKKKKKKTKK